MKKNNKNIIPSIVAHKMRNNKVGPICAIITLVDVDHIDGEDNTAGVQQNIFYGRINDVATFPKPILDDSAGSGDLKDLVTISSNIIMKPGKAMNKLYCTLEASKLDGALQGDLDGKSYMNSVSVFHPGSKDSALGFSQWSKNADLFFLIPEADGQVRLLGYPGYPAKMKSADVTTGQKSGDRKGMTFTFESARKGPAPIFTGQVVLSGSAIGSGAVDANSNTYQDIYFITGS